MIGDTRLPLDRPPGKVVARPCCRSAYLRGAFLGGGSQGGQASPHLESQTRLHGGAAFVRSVAVGDRRPAAVADRGSHSIAYAKSWEAIEAYLAVAGASDTVLALEGAGARRGAFARRQTASRTRITRTSSVRAAPPGCSSRPCAGSRRKASSTGWARRSRRPPSCAVDIRRSLFASSGLAWGTHLSRRPGWPRGSGASSRSRRNRRPNVRARVGAGAARGPYSPRWGKDPGRRNQTPSTARCRSALVREGISSELLPQPAAGHRPAGSRRVKPGSARLPPLEPLWSGARARALFPLPTRPQRRAGGQRNPLTTSRGPPPGESPAPTCSPSRGIRSRGFLLRGASRQSIHQSRSVTACRARDTSQRSSSAPSTALDVAHHPSNANRIPRTELEGSRRRA